MYFVSKILKAFLALIITKQYILIKRLVVMIIQ